MENECENVEFTERFHDAYKWRGLFTYLYAGTGCDGIISTDQDTVIAIAPEDGKANISMRTEYRIIRRDRSGKLFLNDPVFEAFLGRILWWSATEGWKTESSRIPN